MRSREENACKSNVTGNRTNKCNITKSIIRLISALSAKNRASHKLYSYHPVQRLRQCKKQPHSRQSSSFIRFFLNYPDLSTGDTPILHDTLVKTQSCPSGKEWGTYTILFLLLLWNTHFLERLRTLSGRFRWCSSGLRRRGWLWCGMLWKVRLCRGRGRGRSRPSTSLWRRR